MARNEHKKVLQQLSEAYQNVREGFGSALETGGDAASSVSTDASQQISTDTSQQISSEELEKSASVPNPGGVMIEPDAIFVSVDALPHFQKIAQQKGFEGLQFFKMADPDPDDEQQLNAGLIINPYTGDYQWDEKEQAQLSQQQYIKKELFKNNPPNSGFWPQGRIGYKGKHWTPIG